MTLLRPREIRPSPSAARTQPVAKRAVRPELRFAQLCCLRIPSERILFLRVQCRRRCGECKHHRALKESREVPPARPKFISPKICSTNGHCFAVPPWIDGVGPSSVHISFEGK